MMIWQPLGAFDGEIALQCCMISYLYKPQLNICSRLASGQYPGQWADKPQAHRLVKYQLNELIDFSDYSFKESIPPQGQTDL